MPSNLTVEQARQFPSLWTVADPSDPNSSLFLPLINSASEAIITAGQWKGTLGEVNFNSSTGYVTLPRRWESIVADRMCCGGVAPVLGRYSEFSSSGPCFFALPENQRWNLQCLVDQGEYPTQVHQPTALPIRLTISNALDAGQTVRLYGVGTNGETIFDSEGFEGVNYTTVYPSVDTTESMIVTNIVKPMFDGFMSISTVDGTTVTQLSNYEPTETNPLYRRYKVGVIDAHTNGTPVIRTLCKRRYIPLVNEDDLVFPSNVRALGFAMSACKLEQQGSYEVGQSLPFWDQCYKTLNDSLKQARGNIRTPAAFTWPGSAGSLPTTH